jgi:hypothetical protein
MTDDSPAGAPADDGALAVQQGKSRDTAVTTVAGCQAGMISEPGPEAVAAAIAAGWHPG